MQATEASDDRTDTPSVPTGGDKQAVHPSDCTEPASAGVPTPGDGHKPDGDGGGGGGGDDCAASTDAVRVSDPAPVESTPSLSDPPALPDVAIASNDLSTTTAASSTTTADHPTEVPTDDATAGAGADDDDDDVDAVASELGDTVSELRNSPMPIPSTASATTPVSSSTSPAADASPPSATLPTAAFAPARSSIRSGSWAIPLPSAVGVPLGPSDPAAAEKRARSAEITLPVTPTSEAATAPPMGDTATCDTGTTAATTTTTTTTTTAAAAALQYAPVAPDADLPVLDTLAVALQTARLAVKSDGDGMLEEASVLYSESIGLLTGCQRDLLTDDQRQKVHALIGAYRHRIKLLAWSTTSNSASSSSLDQAQTKRAFSFSTPMLATNAPQPDGVLPFMEIRQLSQSTSASSPPASAPAPSLTYPPPPSEPQLRPFWLSHQLSECIRHGAFLHRDLYVAPEIWVQTGPKLTDVPAKMTYFGELVQALHRFSTVMVVENAVSQAQFVRELDVFVASMRRVQDGLHSHFSWLPDSSGRRSDEPVGDEDELDGDTMVDDGTTVLSTGGAAGAGSGGGGGDGGDGGDGGGPDDAGGGDADGSGGGGIKSGSRFLRTFGVLRSFVKERLMFPATRVSKEALISYSRMVVDTLEAFQHVGLWVFRAMHRPSIARPSSTDSGGGGDFGSAPSSPHGIGMSSPLTSSPVGAKSRRAPAAPNVYSPLYTDLAATRQLLAPEQCARCAAFLRPAAVRAQMEAVITFLQDVVCELILRDVRLLTKRYVRRASKGFRKAAR